MVGLPFRTEPERAGLRAVPDRHANPREDLESIADRVTHRRRQRHLGFEDAVDPVANRRAAVVARHLHVAGADVERAADDVIAHLDGDRFGLLARPGAFTARAQPLAEHVQIALRRIAAVERRDDGRARRDHGGGPAARRESEIVVGFRVERPAGRVRQHAIVDEPSAPPDAGAPTAPVPGARRARSTRYRRASRGSQPRSAMRRWVRIACTCVILENWVDGDTPLTEQVAEPSDRIQQIIEVLPRPGLLDDRVGGRCAVMARPRPPPRRGRSVAPESTVRSPVLRRRRAKPGRRRRETAEASAGRGRYPADRAVAERACAGSPTRNA